MADETWKNPHTAVVQCESESEEESDDDLEDEEDRNGIDENKYGPQYTRDQNLSSDVHLNYFELSAFFFFFAF